MKCPANIGVQYFLKIRLLKILTIRKKNIFLLLFVGLLKKNTYFTYVLTLALNSVIIHLPNCG